MLGHQDLANRIRQMREAGDSIDEIASALDACTWRIAI
jgi:DNA-binding transcriptional MerR regulator